MNHSLLLFPFLFCLLVQAAVQTHSAGRVEAERPFEISVNVNLVQVYATVRDRDGKFVGGLSARHFEVYEEGVCQTVRLFAHEGIPVIVGLVVDHSGSMKGKLVENEKSQ